MRYRAINVATNDLLKEFTNRGAVNAWIDEQIRQRGLDWRVGYTIQFRDRVRVEVRDRKDRLIR